MFPLLITAGIYQKGNSPVVDEAIDKHEQIEEFLKQEEFELSEISETLTKLSAIAEIEIPEEEFVEKPAEKILSTAQIVDNAAQKAREADVNEEV